MDVVDGVPRGRHTESNPVVFRFSLLPRPSLRTHSLRTLLLLAAALGVLLPGAVLFWLGAETHHGLTLLGLAAVQWSCCALTVGAVLRTHWSTQLARLQRQAQQLTAVQATLPEVWHDGEELSALGQQLTLAKEQFQDLQEELAFKHAELKCLATHDVVTGLPSRSLLPHFFAQHAALAKRHGDTVALLVVTLTTRPMAAPQWPSVLRDPVVRDAALLLRAALRETDWMCRTGDAEFVALLPRVNQWENVASACERCLMALALPGVRIGVARYPADATELAALQHMAGLAAAHGSATQAAQYHFFQPGMAVDIHSCQSLSELNRPAKRSSNKPVNTLAPPPTTTTATSADGMAAPA